MITDIGMMGTIRMSLGFVLDFGIVYFRFKGHSNFSIISLICSINHSNQLSVIYMCFQAHSLGIVGKRLKTSSMAYNRNQIQQLGWKLREYFQKAIKIVVVC